jgi:hypothetical protein
MHLFRGRHATTWPFETNLVFEFTCFSLKSGLKGKGELGPCKDFHCTLVITPSSYLCSYCLFALNWQFWWGNRVKGPRMILFWCLMPKGEKLSPKQMDQLPLVKFRKSRVRTLWFVKNTLIAIFGKKGEFLEFLALNQLYSWIISLCAQTSEFDLEIGKWIWFSKTNQVVAKYDPNMPNMSQKQFGSLLHWYCTSFCCFWMCWHKSPKRGRLKGKCAIGSFLKYFGD